MKHFTIKELTHTNSGLENIPNSEQEKSLEYLVDNVLDKVREKYGKPITVNSGFRSKEVNEHAGGKDTSQHTKGEAADITGGSKEENIEIYNIIKTLGKYDQLINEYDYKWVHVSYKKGHNRKMELTIK